MANSFYTEEELKGLGLKSCGSNVLISRKCSIYSPEEISIGSNVRIDDFCILSGKITLGNYIHIGAYSALYGNGGICFEDYSGLSPRCTVFSTSDDFSGNWLMGPTIPSKYTNVTHKPVIFHKYVNVGTGTTVMPGVEIQEGTAVGAMSVVRKSLKGWKIYSCLHPLENVGNRSRQIEKLAEELEHEQA